MANTRVTVDGYSIVRVTVHGRYVFQIWRNVSGNSYKTDNDKEYFSDAAKYVASQNGIDGDYRVGYVEALKQIYENN